MRWPGGGRQRGASIRVRGAQNIDEVIQQEGEWGLFRLLEQGTIEGNPAITRPT
jgi:type VI secretion system protein ImpL